VLGVSERRACRGLAIARSVVRYRPTRPAADAKLVRRLYALSERHSRLGYRKITVQLRREGWRVNEKRVARLWRQRGLGVPVRGPKRRRLGPQTDGSERYRATRPHDVWAVGFLFDATSDGGVLKILTVTDEFSKTCLALRTGRSFKAKGVIDVVENLMVVYGPPIHVRSDNGPEFVARAVQAFLAAAGVQAMFIQPGAPWQSPFAESFGARFRDELLDQESFQSVREARSVRAALQVIGPPAAVLGPDRSAPASRAALGTPISYALARRYPQWRTSWLARRTGAAWSARPRTVTPCTLPAPVSRTPSLRCARSCSWWVRHDERRAWPEAGRGR